MTQNEKNIVRQLGYARYTLYKFIEANPYTSCRIITEELGVDRRSIHGHLKKLKDAGLIKYTGVKVLTRYVANPEEDWNL